MKTTFTILATIVVAAAAFAGPGKKASKTTIHCAVMPADSVNIADATKNHMYADYKGNRYFFCCGGCPDSFKKDPAKYAKSEHIKTPKAKKGKK